MHKTTRKLGAIAVICSLLLSLATGAAGAQVTWQNTGKSLWLNAGSGLNLSTGGAGEDLFLTGTQVTAKGGMALAPGATLLSSLLAPPTTGYATSLDVSAVENKVLVIKLVDGGYAQVAVGMGWRSGQGYSSLEISGWYTRAAQAEPEPEPAPLPPLPVLPPGPAPAPTPETDAQQQPEPDADADAETALPPIPAGTAVVWDYHYQWAMLEAGSGLNLLTGGEGRHLTMTAQQISAPGGLALIDDSLALRDLAAVEFRHSLAVREAENKVLLVRLGDGRYARIKTGDAWRSGGGYASIELDYWLIGVNQDLPESELDTQPYQLQTAPPADQLTTVPPGMPGPMLGRAAVWTGEFVYFWTGGGAYRLNPATGAVTGMARTFQDGSMAGPVTSVWDGTYAYTVYAWLGSETGRYDDFIVRYDPTTDTARVMEAALPPSQYSAAVWTGRYVYIFGATQTEGAAWGPQPNTLILRYDPVTDSVQTMRAALPAATEYRYLYLSAVWDGKHVYLFGFDDGSILRYDPAADTLRAMRAVVPGKLTETAAFFDGRHIYLLGGEDEGWTATDGIYRYDRSLDRLTAVKSRLPAVQQGGAAVWVGDGAFVLGGRTWSDAYRHILRYSTGNTGQSLLPERRPAEAEVSLTAAWQEGKAVLSWPAFGAPNGGYYVFRGDAAGKYDPMPLTDFPVQGLSFTDTSAQPDGVYYYVVKAYSGGVYVAVSDAVRLGSAAATTEASVDPADESPPAGSEATSPPADPKEETAAAEPQAKCGHLSTGTGLVSTLRLSFTPGALHLKDDCTAWLRGLRDANLHLLRLSDGQRLASIWAPNNQARISAYSAVGDIVFWVTETGSVRLYDGSTGDFIKQVELSRIQWWDIPAPIGALVDPETGRLFVYQSDAFWTVDRTGTAAGPYKADAGPGGVTAATIQGHTLWLLGRPANEDTPTVAVPVDLQSLKTGAAVTLLEPGVADFSLGVSFAVAPDHRTFYVGAQDQKGIFVATVRGGRVLQRLDLAEFRLTPLLSLSPDGARLAIRDPGTAYTPLERAALTSVFGNLIVVRTADFATLVAAGGAVADKQKPGWFVSDAGKPTFAVYTADGRLLLVGDSTADTLLLYWID